MCVSAAFGSVCGGVVYSATVSWGSLCVGWGGFWLMKGRKQPLFIITTLLGISAIFKSYPSIGDTALYLSLLSLYRHVFPRKLPP